MEVEGAFKAYPVSELSGNGLARFEDTFNGINLVIHWNEEARSGKVTDDNGNLLPAISSFWFAWYTFHPETEIFKAVKH